MTFGEIYKKNAEGTRWTIPIVTEEQEPTQHKVTAVKSKIEVSANVASSLMTTGEDTVKQYVLGRPFYGSAMHSAFAGCFSSGGDNYGSQLKKRAHW